MLAVIEAGLHPVDDVERSQVGRGRELADRMDRLGISGHELHGRTGVARSTITGAQRGNASDRIYRILEQALEDEELARERGHQPPSVGPQDVDESAFVEVTIKGNFGVSAIVKGPVDRPEDLERMLSAILREIKEDK